MTKSVACILIHTLRWERFENVSGLHARDIQMNYDAWFNLFAWLFCVHHHCVDWAYDCTVYRQLNKSYLFAMRFEFIHWISYLTEYLWGFDRWQNKIIEKLTSFVKCIIIDWITIYFWSRIRKCISIHILLHQYKLNCATMVQWIAKSVVRIAKLDLIEFSG